MAEHGGGTQGKYSSYIRCSLPFTYLCIIETLWSNVVGRGTGIAGPAEGDRIAGPAKNRSFGGSAGDDDQVRATTWTATRLGDATTIVCSNSTSFYYGEYVYECFTFYAHA
jgi:hypothetical protein